MESSYSASATVFCSKSPPFSWHEGSSTTERTVCECSTHMPALYLPVSSHRVSLILFLFFFVSSVSLIVLEYTPSKPSFLSCFFSACTLLFRFQYQNLLEAVCRKLSIPEQDPYTNRSLENTNRVDRVHVMKERDQVGRDKETTSSNSVYHTLFAQLSLLPLPPIVLLVYQGRSWTCCGSSW